ncbi:MAG: asparaginase [Alphaproteobacteria bacterium]|nr:asparaginase [Alphaproteobacteria bacterium]
MRLPGTDPLVVEVTRGPMVESAHRVHAAVVDPSGTLVARWGDAALRVFPRSAVKPIQALPLIESGAADAFAVSAAELALAAASHSGEDGHVAAVGAWLTRLGVAPACLCCGTDDTARLADNCSGKHTGFITLARHLGAPVETYFRLDHPVQVAVRETLREMAGTHEAAVANDGCGVPTFALPLGALATAFARLGHPGGLAPARAAAAKRMLDAMTRHPHLVAGTGRLETAVMARRPDILIKGGAEGVFAAALPARALGIAVKAEDGAGRASGVAILAVLRYLEAFDDGDAAALAPHLAPPVTTRAGVTVGQIRIA